MKLLELSSEYEISWWALNQCREGNNTKQMRDLITDGVSLYWYCINVKDIKEMWSKITDDYWARIYCQNVKDRPEVRKYIK